MSCLTQSLYICWIMANWCSAETGSPGSKGASSLTASAPISLIFSTDQPGSVSPIGPPALFLPEPDFSTRTSIPLSGGRAPLAIAGKAP